MIPVEAHLALNHVPLIGLVFGLVFFVAGLWRSSEPAVRAGLRIFLAMGIAIWPVVGSGLVSATILAKAAWLDASALSSHRLAGILTLVVLGALATLSGVTLFVSRRNGLPMSVRARNAVLILAIAGLAANLWTAFLGGALRHTELAAGRARASTQGVVTTDRGTTSSVFALQPRVRHRTASDSGGRHGMRHDGGDDERDHRTDCRRLCCFQPARHRSGAFSDALGCRMGERHGGRLCARARCGPKILDTTVAGA
jgi:hypothetical protein